MFKSFLTKTAPVLALSIASVGLLSAAAADSTTFSGSITLNSSQFDNYFVYDANGGAMTGTKAAGVTNPFTGQQHFIPAGTFPLTESIPEYITGGVATALGMYSPTGVSIAVNENVYNAALGKETWDQVFAGTQESSIATALANDDETTLLNFLNQYSNDFISFTSNTAGPISGGILQFSTAADGGSLSFASITAVGTPPVTATPEPSTELLFGAGLGLVGLAARKFRRA